MKIKNTLIIEDEIDICMLLKNFLTKKNSEVSVSTTLQDGIAKFTETQPDLLILDHNLPDGHGIEYISKFKEQRKEKKSSFVIIVISAMSNLKEVALANGADFFIEKPISFSRLNDILKK